MTHDRDISIWSARIDRSDQGGKRDSKPRDEGSSPSAPANRVDRQIGSTRWQWAQRPKLVTAIMPTGSTITMSIAAIAHEFGKASARYAVREAEQCRHADEAVAIRGYFTRHREQRAREREERAYMRTLARRERFWSGLRRVTQEAWNGGKR